MKVLIISKMTLKEKSKWNENWGVYEEASFDGGSVELQDRHSWPLFSPLTEVYNIYIYRPKWKWRMILVTVNYWYISGVSHGFLLLCFHNCDGADHGGGLCRIQALQRHLCCQRRGDVAHNQRQVQGSLHCWQQSPHSRLRWCFPRTPHPNYPYPHQLQEVASVNSFIHNPFFIFFYTFLIFMELFL